MATEKELMDAGILITVDQAEDNYHMWLAKKEGRHCERCGHGNGYHADDCSAPSWERAEIHVASDFAAEITRDEFIAMIRGLVSRQAKTA